MNWKMLLAICVVVALASAPVMLNVASAFNRAKANGTFPWRRVVYKQIKIWHLMAAGVALLVLPIVWEAIHPKSMNDDAVWYFVDIPAYIFIAIGGILFSTGIYVARIGNERS